MKSTCIYYAKLALASYVPCVVAHLSTPASHHRQAIFKWKGNEAPHIFTCKYTLN